MEELKKPDVGSKASRTAENQFITHLKDLVHWEKFALHLPGIKQSDIDTIKEEVKHNISREKQALFYKWLNVCPNASWENVIEALKKADELIIADDIKSRFSDLVRPTSTSMMLLPPSEKIIEEIKVEEKIVKGLDKLNDSFLSLTSDTKNGIEAAIRKRKFSVNFLVHHTKEHTAVQIKALQCVKTTDEFFQAILPHYSFLNCHLIVRLATLLSGSIAQRANEYNENVSKFKKGEQVRSLYHILWPYYQLSRTSKTNIMVSLAVENTWGNQSMWLVEVFVQTMFPKNHHSEEYEWIEVVPG